LPDDGQPPEDGTARNLPAVRGRGDVEPEILEGVIVEAPPSGPARVIHAARAVARHERTRAAGRHLGYIPLGAAVVAKRLWDSRTTARYERWLRIAEAQGDQESALEWEKRMAAFRKDRHERRTDMIRVPAELLLQLPKLAFGLFLILAATGTLLAIARGHIAEVAVPVKLAARIAGWIAIALSVSWGPVVLSLPWIALGALWWTGRGYAAAAGWTAAAKADEEEGGMVITADTIVLALQHTPIPDLRKAFKDGWRPTFHTLPVRDGRGYSAVFGVPLGVTPEMIADRNPVFARNLHRAQVECWPTNAERGGVGPAGTVALWVADPGVLDKPAPEYPLLHEGTADVFTGVPVGVSPRGAELLLPVVGNNFVAGGLMGQGKSNACRLVFLGAALDPLAELIVHVFAYNGDFDSYRPRLSRYVKGAEDEQVDAAMATLHELYAEVGQREQMLADLGAKKVTRQLAERHPELRPKLALFSECHELFGDKDHGEEATELAVKTIRRARKTAVWTGYDTQDARKDAIPPKLVGLVSVNCCFAVKTWRANDGFLGDGSFAAGIRATELRPGRDVGRSLITGVSDAQFEIMKWYYVEVDDDTGFDAAADVIARACAGVARGTRAGASAPAAIEARDLLEDLDEVTGDERVKLADLPARLRKLAPAWGAYRSLTAVRLRELLDDEGVRVTNTGNVLRLDPADLRRALAGRE